MSEKNDLTFLRVRSKDKEIMVSPGLFYLSLLFPEKPFLDKDFMLMVIQGPKGEAKDQNE